MTDGNKRSRIISSATAIIIVAAALGLRICHNARTDAVAEPSPVIATAPADSASADSSKTEKPKKKKPRKEPNRPVARDFLDEHVPNQ